ncbi:MAG: metallopeptidase TldD-related protein [bacterium]
MRADAILAMARHRADAAEVYDEESDRTVVEFRGGRFQSQVTRLTRGCGLRVIKDGRLGFSSSTNDERYDELVDAALETAVLGRPAAFGFAGPAAMPTVAACESRVMLHPLARMIEWGRELCAAMRARVPELALDLAFDRTWHETRVRTTAGLEAESARATFELAASGVIAGDGIFWLPEYVNLSDGRHFDPGPLCDRLEAAARRGRRRARLASGTHPVIVLPLALPALLAPLRAGVDGRQAARRTSPLAGREGERILAGVLTISDDPLRSHGLESTPFDGEGLPARRNPLFERGVFRGFLHDLASAAAVGAESTGSARRDYASPPGPGVSNLEIEPGTTPLEQAIAATSDGLLVAGFVGDGQSNVLAGEVALNATSAFRIEGGELAGRVKDAMVAGNVYEMLASVDLVGAEVRDLGRQFLPWLRFPALRVATRD